jgi:Holliday junction resolvase RusA-like endonuclease
VEPCARYVGGTPHENLPCVHCGVTYEHHQAAEVRHTTGGQWYIIDGINPEPWEAPTGEARRKKAPEKGFFVQMVTSEKQRSYQDAVRDAMRETYGEPDMATVDISVQFYFWRQKSNIADATNLQKSTEDALQGILFKNDRQVKKVFSEIVEQEDETEPMILIHVAPYIPTDFWVLDLATAMRDDLREMQGTPEPIRTADRADADDFF